MATQHTPTPRNESEAKHQALETYLDRALAPSVERMKAEDRVTDSLYDAVREGNRIKFQQLWKQHVVPLARQKEAEKDSSTPPPSGNPK